MAPKKASPQSLGCVAQHGCGWRAQLAFDGKKIRGPLRAEKKAAEADLTQAQAAGSRASMQQVLEALKTQVREDSQSSASGVPPPIPNEETSASGVPPPTANDGEPPPTAKDEITTSSSTFGVPPPIAPHETVAAAPLMVTGAVYHARRRPPRKRSRMNQESANVDASQPSITPAVSSGGVPPPAATENSLQGRPSSNGCVPPLATIDIKDSSEHVSGPSQNRAIKKRAQLPTTSGAEPPTQKRCRNKAGNPKRPRSALGATGREVEMADTLGPEAVAEVHACNEGLASQEGANQSKRAHRW